MTEERGRYMAGERPDLEERLAHVLYLAATKVVQELWPRLSPHQFSLRRASLWDALSRAVEARVKEQGWAVAAKEEEPVANG